MSFLFTQTLIIRAIDVLFMVKKQKKRKYGYKKFLLGPPGFEPGPPDERKHLHFLLMLYRFT